MARRKTTAAKVVSISKRREHTQITRVGWIAGRGPDGDLLVDFAGNRRGALAARTTVRVTAGQVIAEPATAVVLLFESDRARPVVIGVIQRGDAVEPEANGGPAALEGLSVDLDGNRVVLSAKHEIVLKCGEAEIVLRSNGRVLIRGVHVETRSKGLNRIKGGAVHIN